MRVFAFAVIGVALIVCVVPCLGAEKKPRQRSTIADENVRVVEETRETAPADASAAQSFFVESRVVDSSNPTATENAWLHRGMLTVNAASATAKNPVKFSSLAQPPAGSPAPYPGFKWTKALVQALSGSGFLQTRVRSLEGNEVASIVLSSCSLLTTCLRSAGHLHLHEHYSVALNQAANNTVIGLQFAPSGRADLCDAAIFDAIVAKGPVEQSVAVSRLGVLRSPEFPVGQLIDTTKVGTPAAAQEAKKPTKDGKPEKEEEPGFLQKYWWVFLIMVGIQVAGALFNPPAPAAGAEGGAATAPAASVKKNQ